MKQKGLLKKLAMVTVGIGLLFFIGTYFVQAASEMQVLSNANVVSEKEFTEETVKEYYEKSFESGKTIISQLEEKFGPEISQLSLEELSDEQYNYLNAVYYLNQYKNNEILAQNEKNVEYAEEMSLESSLSEIMAMTPDENTEKIIEQICKEANVNPDGKIKDLTADLIVEIDRQLFEYEQKNFGH